MAQNKQLQSRRWKVGGHVQGVGYRFFVQHKAIPLDLTGWARNLDDGSVEVLARGRPDRLDALNAALYIGPQAAEVRSVEIEPVSDRDARLLTDITGFNIR